MVAIGVGDMAAGGEGRNHDERNTDQSVVKHCEERQADTQAM